MADQNRLRIFLTNGEHFDMKVTAWNLKYVPGEGLSEFTWTIADDHMTHPAYLNLREVVAVVVNP